MTRRDFMTTSIALTASAVIAPSAYARTPKYRMGLQLFTVRDAMKKDAADTLRRISELGYQDLETYGFDADALKYYGLDATAFKNLLTEHKLTTSSGHYDLFLFLDKPPDALKKYTDQAIKGAHALGQRYITWPWLTPESRTIEKFKLLADRLNIVGEQVTKSGLGFAYHNHDFEFVDHHGENGYDIIMKNTDPALVKLQIDLYWVMHSSKLSPSELFSKQPGRFVMWHIKDMDKVSRDYTELGNGSIDYKVILPDASRSGLQLYFLEQGGNFAKNSMQSIADSAKFFKKHLERLL
jgi:sugar phosphate isomerase/epimerase